MKAINIESYYKKYGDKLPTEEREKLRRCIANQKAKKKAKKRLKKKGKVILKEVDMKNDMNKGLIRTRRKAEISVLEQKVVDFLEFWGIEYLMEYHHKTLFNPQKKSLLFLDFYLPKHHIAIEVNGKHHYQDKDHARLQDQRHRDHVKVRWCKRNAVKLITIPYWEMDLIEITLGSALQIR